MLIHVQCDGLAVFVLLIACACRTKFRARHYSRKVPAMGTFRGAKVTRGADWQWGNQDGESLVKNVYE